MDRSDDGPRAPDRHKNSGRSNSRDQKPIEVFSPSSIAYQSAISSLSLYSSTLAEVDSLQVRDLVLQMTIV